MSVDSVVKGHLLGTENQLLGDALKASRAGKRLLHIYVVRQLTLSWSSPIEKKSL
jgi:hypothetical protein